jgi:hypothetical protein
VAYVPGRLTVYLDDGAEPVLVADIDIAWTKDDATLFGSWYTDPSGAAWIGFTGSVGTTATAVHHLLSWTFESWES